jgi:phage-related protein
MKQTIDTVSFVDGSEQRCAATAALHEWTIQLDLIDEQELNALETFIKQQQGETGNFAFTDPVDGVQYSNCSLSFEVLSETFHAPGRVATVLIIRENPR